MLCLCTSLEEKAGPSAQRVGVDTKLIRYLFIYLFIKKGETGGKFSSLLRVRRVINSWKSGEVDVGEDTPSLCACDQIDPLPTAFALQQLSNEPL